jgi:hypothetical protein
MNLLEQISNMFGYTKNPEKEMDVSTEVESFVLPNADGAIVVESNRVNFSYDLDPSASTNEVELIRRYRDISRIPEVSYAIDEIVNEMMSEDAEGNVVKLNTDDLKFSNSIKNKISNEFDEVMTRIQFNQKAYDLVRRWYIDGRIYFHKIWDQNEGLIEARYISPTTIRRVVEIEKSKNQTGVETNKTKKEYFTYQAARKGSTIAINDSGNGMSGVLTAPGYNGSSSLGSIDQLVKIAPDAIAYVTSGLYDEEYSCILSYLHPALKTANNLRTLEDSMVLYRIARAPERRIFYVDVGNMPPQKAEQYMKDMMNKFRTNLTYDALTGEVKDARRNMSMLEDFWIPRRGDGKSTEISTLESGANLGEVDDLELMKKKLYKSLNVPLSRLSDEAPMVGGLGRTSEITRDEIKFQKFIDRLRNKFSLLLIDLLITQLIVKKIIRAEESEDIKRQLSVEWSKDSFYTELKETEIIRERFTTVQMADMFVGKYVSKEYVMKQILLMSDEEYDEMNKQIDDEGITPPDAADAPTQFADTAAPAQQPDSAPTDEPAAPDDQSPQ